MNIRQGIQKFLESKTQDSPYLIPKWNIDLETQVMCHEGSCPLDESGKVWVADGETWSNHRWPYRAMSDPQYTDRELTYSPRTHLKLVGSTWWDFVRRKSIASVFDIDSQAGHAGASALSEEELQQVKDLLLSLDYVTLIRSKSGQGIHVYTFYEEDDLPDANNHNEHSFVAQAALTKMCHDSKTDLTKYIDCKGAVLWLWSDKIEPGGFEVIREGRRLKASELGPISLPATNKAVKIQGFTDSGSEAEETSEEYTICPLDETHKQILRELEEMGWYFSWSSEFSMCHTHTRAIAELFDKRAREGNPIKGIFKTVSGGTDKSKPNAFMSPRPGGVFRIARFGVGVTEHPTWERWQEKTWCYLNQHAPTLNTLKRFCTDYNGHEFTFTANELEGALQALDCTLGSSKEVIQDPIKVTLENDGTFVARTKGTYENLRGWTKKGNQWHTILPVTHHELTFAVNQLEEADKHVRYVVTPQFEDYGWAVKLETEDRWVVHRSWHPVSCTVGRLFGKDASHVHDLMLRNPWRLTHQPFGPEYPGNRLWNKDSPQLAIQPAGEPGPHSHWNLIMEHLGHSLDPYTGQEWCSRWGIQTGADYLRMWIACLIQCPDQPLPYLFIHGVQDSGKSIFYESIAMLFTCGVVSAANAITSGSGFNSELASCVLAYIDEKDLSTVKDLAYARIKEWVTARTLSIHKKGMTPYSQPNTVHFVQTANSALACPVEDGDTRITVIEVYPIKETIPKSRLEKLLAQEAPYFLRTLLTTQIPDPLDRLRMPVLETSSKRELGRINQKPVESFASEVLRPCPGAVVKCTEFYEAYQQFCAVNNLVPEGQISVVRQLKNRSDLYLVGRHGGTNQNHIANVTMDDKASPGTTLELNESGRLVECIE